MPTNPVFPRTSPTAHAAASRSHPAASLVAQWWQVIRHPSIATFDVLRARANWRAVWLSLLLLALIEGLAVAVAIYGPDAALGYSSLPLGPKMHLPQTPLLPLTALLGSVAQFLGFSGLLYVSARAFGGQGSFRDQSYLLALGWVPLLGTSDLIEFVPGIGAWLAIAVRTYMLILCVFALASAHRLSVTRAAWALGVLVLAGLALGAVAVVLVAVGVGPVNLAPYLSRI